MYESILSQSIGIFDFSHENAAMLKRRGISPPVSVMPFYTTSSSGHHFQDPYTKCPLEKCFHNVGIGNRKCHHVDEDEHDIDILFFGSFNARRRHFFGSLENEFKAEGLLFNIITKKVGMEKNGVTHLGWYGLLLEKQVRRAKIVLIPHQDNQSSLEVHRINLLLGLGVAVIVESSAMDELLDAPYVENGALALVSSLTEMYEVAKFLLMNDTALKVLLLYVIIVRYYSPMSYDN